VKNRISKWWNETKFQQIQNTISKTNKSDGAMSLSETILKTLPKWFQN